MAHLTKLDPASAHLLAMLFPPSTENHDLAVAFQRWATEEIDLTADQARRALAAIRDHTIPKAEALVRRNSQPVLRRDSVQTLAAWRALGDLFAQFAKQHCVALVSTS